MTDPETRLAAALHAVDAGHAAGRDRLLAALAAEPVPVTPRRRFDMVRRHWRSELLAATVAATLVVGFLAVRPPGALAATAAAIREAGSFRARMSVVDFPGGVDAAGTDAGVFSWAAEGTRFEEQTNGEAQVTIERVGKPGIEVHHGTQKTYQWLEPEREANPFLKLVGGLADARGRGAVAIGKRKVGEVLATGYELPLSRLDAKLPDDGTLQVWFDPATKRPVRLVVTGAGAPAGKAMRVDAFEWGLPTDGWFDTTPPDGYTERKSLRPTDDEVAELIVFGLKTYAGYTGHYPKVRNVYGDQMADELAKLMGADRNRACSIRIDPPFDPADLNQVYGRATMGTTWINGLQRKNPDCAYNGRTVGPADADKVLVRWQLPDGRYKVVFGDLGTETVTADRLKRLER